jgi:hypothetical protein
MAESSSNLKSYFSPAMEIALKLATGWTLNEVAAKEKLKSAVYRANSRQDASCQ